MPSVQYGTGAYKRTNGSFPPLTLINMFLEKAKTSENEVALLSREGLVSALDTGSASPVVGIFSKEGCFNNDRFIVLANGKLYREGALLGTIAGSGPVSIDGSDNEVCVTKGSMAYSYNGNNLAAIAFPDGANVRAVCFLNERFVFVRDGSAKFYWSNLLDGRTVDPLNFATAERQPDHLLDCVAQGDLLWLMGEATVEGWSNDGSNANIPFSRIENVAFDVGVKATGCTALADNAVHFIGSDDVLYRVADTPQRLSDHDWEEHNGASSTHALFTFQYQGHVLLVLRLDSETLAYDLVTQQPCEFQTSQSNWIANCATTQGDTVYFGHASSGKVLKFSGDTDLGAQMESRFTFAQPLDKATPIYSVHVWADNGHTSISGSRTIELRMSDDAGNTWSNWDAEDLGAIGQYRHVPQWRALGMFDFPGVMGELRVMGRCRVSAVKVNDDLAGRSR